MGFDNALQRHSEECSTNQWSTGSWARHEHDFSFQPIKREPVDEGGWKVLKFRPRANPQKQYRVAVTVAVPDAQIELRRLADEWLTATMFTSSAEKMFMHPAYQQIIGFGEKALPFLIDELRSSDGHWFWALRMIARVDPVPPQESGNYPAMKRAWLDWAAENNL